MLIYIIRNVSITHTHSINTNSTSIDNRQAQDHIFVRHIAIVHSIIFSLSLLFTSFIYFIIDLFDFVEYLLIHLTTLLERKAQWPTEKCWFVKKKEKLLRKKESTRAREEKVLVLSSSSNSNEPTLRNQFVIDIISLWFFACFTFKIVCTIVVRIWIKITSFQCLKIT